MQELNRVYIMAERKHAFILVGAKNKRLLVLFLAGMTAAVC